MDGIKNWIDQNIDKKQMKTLLLTSVMIGGTVYVLRQAGYGKVATVVKGG